MTNTFTQTETRTFTVTHAKHLAAKVVTDLKRIQRFYHEPLDDRIANLQEELIALLKNGYLKKITYGFQRSDRWIAPTLSFTAEELSSVDGVDDDPGRVLPGADISGASFCTYLERNQAYFNLSYSERQQFEERLPFKRGSGPVPGAEGYFSRDLSYSSGGRSLNRSTLKTW